MRRTMHIAHRAALFLALICLLPFVLMAQEPKLPMASAELLVRGPDSQPLLHTAVWI